jgi:hypothetical protein
VTPFTIGTAVAPQFETGRTFVGLVAEHGFATLVSVRRGATTTSLLLETTGTAPSCPPRTGSPAAIRPRCALADETWIGGEPGRGRTEEGVQLAHEHRPCRLVNAADGCGRPGKAAGRPNSGGGDAALLNGMTTSSRACATSVGTATCARCGRMSMAALRNLVITALRLNGVINIAAALRRHARDPHRPLARHLQDHLTTSPRPWGVVVSIARRTLMTLRSTHSGLRARPGDWRRLAAICRSHTSSRTSGSTTGSTGARAA